MTLIATYLLLKEVRMIEKLKLSQVKPHLKVNQNSKTTSFQFFTITEIIIPLVLLISRSKNHVKLKTD